LFAFAWDPNDDYATIFLSEAFDPVDFPLVAPLLVLLFPLLLDTAA
jgi:hypothetical protein